MNLLDLLSTDEGGTGLADHEPVVHIITPDFATLCRLGYLEARALGDRCPVSPHKDDRDRVPAIGSWNGLLFKTHRHTRIRWRNITCPWCRSLGVAYYRHAVTAMGHAGAAA